MKIKLFWAITIMSWLMFIMNIVLPFTGIVVRDWGSLAVWAGLSTFWTTHLSNVLIEEKDRKIEEQHDKNKSGQ